MRSKNAKSVVFWIKREFAPCHGCIHHDRGNEAIWQLQTTMRFRLQNAAVRKNVSLPERFQKLTWGGRRWPCAGHVPAAA